MGTTGSLLRYELALLAVVLIWGCNFTVMKGAVERMDPLLFNAARVTLSVVFLGGLVLLGQRRAPASADRLVPPRSLWLVVLGLGFVGHVGYQAGFVLGLERTTSGTSSLLIASAPLWTGLVGHVTGVEVLTRRAWLGIAVAFAGTALIASASGVDLAPEALSGNLLTVGAAACWGIYTTWNRPYLARHSPTAMAFWTMAVATPFLWVIAWPALRAFDVAQIDAPLVGSAVYAGLFGTGVAYVLWNVGVRHVGPARTSTTVFLVPVVALILGSVALGERVGAVELGGGAIVIAGLATMGRPRRRKTE